MRLCGRPGTLLAGRRCEMSTTSQDRPSAVPERPRFAVRLLVPEMWASLAIAVMWLAVLSDAVWGPDFVSTTADGNSTTIPSAIVVAVFAYLGTRVVAKYGFGSQRDRTD